MLLVNYKHLIPIDYVNFYDHLFLIDSCRLSSSRRSKRVFYTARAGKRQSRGRGKLQGGDVVTENIYITEVKKKKESSDSSEDDSTRAELLQQGLDMSTEEDKNTAL